MSFPLRASAFFIILLLIISQTSFGQLYDPVYRPDVEWKEINTDRFRMIFPESAEVPARRSLRILESQYDEIQELVGGELENFPVVLNDYNDRTGGVVSTNHFRIEVETPPRRGKSLNLQTGGWLELVMPHELVHALHFSVTPSWSLSRLIRPFAPDIAPSFHLTAPLGMTEGIAVYQESKVRPDKGGRGNHPFFTNQIMANFDSGERWSIGELVYPSARTRPGGRHYFGGYVFTDWLHQEYGEDITKRIIEDVNRRFFLGYGFSLRNTTGKWPSTLEEKFHDYQADRYQPKLDSISNAGITPYELVDTGMDGDLINRPKYLDEDRLLFYGSFYNERAGLWQLSGDYENSDRIYTGTMTDDYQYTFGDEGSVYFSRQVTHPYHHNTWKMDYFELNPNNGDTKRLTDRARIHSPEPVGNDLFLGLQTHKETSQLVEIRDGNVQDTLISIYPDHISEIAVHPEQKNRLAAIANINGEIGIWLIDSDNPELNKSEPELTFPGSGLYDLTWHPEKEKLMFTAEPGDVMNIYEWDLTEDEIHQVTNTLYNAFEASYHPSGDRIAFVVQRASTQELALLDRENFFNRSIDEDKRENQIAGEDSGKRLGDDKLDESRNWETEEYRTGIGWLRPRAIFPIAEFDSTFPEFQFGATMTSGDVLRRNKYEMSLSYGEEYLWYDASYTRRGWYPGYTLRAFSQPLSSGNEGFQQQGINLQTSFPYTLENNLYLSNFLVRPDVRYTRLRGVYQNGVLPQPTAWLEQYRASIRFSTNIRLQQNIQDIQPNTGLQLFNEWFAGYTEEFEGRPDFAVSGGIFSYLSPLRRFNQSLRTGIEFQYSDGILLDQAGLLRPGFRTGDIPDREQVLRLSTRYTIPIVHADRAWITIPSQLQSIYLALFTNTLSPLDITLDQTGINKSRTAYGAELRTRFDFFNLTFDAGVRFSYEPTRDQMLIGFVL